jgi:transcription antitermination protein NusB
VGPATVSSDGATRHQARERALSLLYEAEMKGVPPSTVVAGLPVAPDPFASWLVQQVESHAEESASLIAEASVGWTLERMAVVDRLVLELAVAELLNPQGPPVAVVIDEAVELAKAYSTDESGRFVNGILSTIATGVRAERAEDGPSAERAEDGRRAD